MRLLNLRIDFYSLRTFCPHLGSFCVVSSFTTLRPNFTSGLLQVILPRPRIGMLSLTTVSPVITAFHSCCLITPRFWPSKPLARLGRIWNRYLLTEEPKRLNASIRCATGIEGWIKVGFFGLINPTICSPYLVFHKRVRTEFVIVFIGNPFWDEAS